jgi:SulP family sulfate permease
MMMVVLGTFEWSSFRILHKIPRADAFVLILVSGVTVFTDLAMAVVVGVIVSALVYAWGNATRMHARTGVNKSGGKVYEIEGPLFFGSVQSFRDLFTPDDDPDDVVVDFRNSRVADHSGLEAIDTLAERYTRRDKRLHLKHLSPECRKLLSRARDLVEVNVIEDPRYHVAADQLE